MMILHICIEHDTRRTSFDFGVNRSKVKVIFGLWTFYHFRTITPFPFGIKWWYFTRVLTMTWEGPLLILGSKGQGHIWTWNFLPFLHKTPFPFWTCNIFHELRWTPIEFGAKRLKLNWESVSLLPWGVFVPF